MADDETMNLAREATLDGCRGGNGRGNSAPGAPPMPAALPTRKVGVEARVLRGVLALAGCLIIASALCGNAGSMLLSLAACLACASRIERNHRRGAYGRTEVELIE